MISKQILIANRVRRPPKGGWSWIDRRFVREHASGLSHEAILLYFFLAAVSDKDGLSFYGDASIAAQISRIKALPNVIMAEMVYHYLAEDERIYEAMPPELIEQQDGFEACAVPAYLNS